MSGYVFFHIRHALVSQFDIISIDNFSDCYILYMYHLLESFSCWDKPEFLQPTLNPVWLDICARKDVFYT